MNNAAFVAVIGIVLALPGCTPESARTVDAKAARGAELLAPLKKDLKQALLAGMQQGPLNAISVCKVQAPVIADSLSVDGVKMGRSSHRLRNTANVAPDWASKILKTYLSEPFDREPAVVSLPDKREGYVEPIVLQPLCVACHGKALAPDVAARIDKEYPGDQATGFGVGDLRGVFWVEYPTTE